VASRSRSIRELTIRNIGVIDQASISLGPGFNVITGETGAGKTMVLTGLNLIAGTRSDTDLIRQGCERLSVSAIVAVEADPQGDLRDLIEEHAPDIEDESLLLQRSLSADGRSKALVGSDPATLSLLQRFAAEFFVIHGQGTNHKLLDHGYQLEILDRTRDKIKEILAQYQSELTLLRQKEREYKDLQSALDHRDREIGNISRFLQESDRIRLTLDEWNEIEAKINRLDSVEELRLAVTGAVNALEDESQGVVNQLHTALRSLEQFKGDQRFNSYGARLRSAQVEINEVVQELHSELASLDVDPNDLDRLRERRAALKQFLQRHRGEAPDALSESEALDHLFHLIPKKRLLLADLEGSDERLGEIKAEIEELRIKVGEFSSTLSIERKIAAADLAKRVNSELQELGLSRSNFSIAVAPTSSRDFAQNGADEIEFLFAAHESGKALPLNKGASGGELSRVMLGIELALAEHREMGTLIFDEIDAGIGGEAGLVIGERISRLANQFQVIVITHLAQVAVWADRHFKIEKNSSDEIVLSSVSEVTEDERVNEIARMLSGQSDLLAARIHAGELLKHAGK
jgi:DNA repair protein RecN (Recombination protein N)